MSVYLIFNSIIITDLQITWSCKRFVEAADCQPGEEVIVSYLPLSNITTQMFDIYGMIACGGSCYFSPTEVRSKLSTASFIYFPPGFITEYFS